MNVVRLQQLIDQREAEHAEVLYQLERLRYENAQLMERLFANIEQRLAIIGDALRQRP